MLIPNLKFGFLAEECRFTKEFKKGTDVVGIQKYLN